MTRSVILIFILSLFYFSRFHVLFCFWDFLFIVLWQVFIMLDKPDEVWLQQIYIQQWKKFSFLQLFKNIDQDIFLLLFYSGDGFEIVGTRYGIAFCQEKVGLCRETLYMSFNKKRIFYHFFKLTYFLYICQYTQNTLYFLCRKIVVNVDVKIRKCRTLWIP